MRVLFLARTLTVGGIEPHMMTLGAGLMATGCTVAIASDGGQFQHRHGVQWFTSQGFRHHSVPFPSPAAGAANVVRSAFRSAAVLRDVISEFQPDIIHVHYRATSPYARLAQVTSGPPFITTLHILPIPAGPFHRVASFWGERTIAISSDAREYLIKAFHVQPDRIRMVPNGVDENYFRHPLAAERAEARRKFCLKDGEPVVALVGRMSKPKGHDVLFRALARLRRSGTRVVALLAGVSIEGDTTWRDAMVELAADLGITDQVQFLGFTETRDVLWASDVLALPSRTEGFPLSVVEAMLAGVTPVRTPAAGAADQIDDGLNGFIVPFEDSDALADRLVALVEDPERRNRMRAAARDKAVREFSAGAMVVRTRAVYEEVLR